jgi:hypothetical protein
LKIIIARQTTFLRADISDLAKEAWQNAASGSLLAMVN